MKSYSDTTVIPVALFVFSRPNQTRRTLEALSQNFLSSQVALYIFSDGIRCEEDKSLVTEVRNICKEDWGFHSVNITEAPHNQGLARSVIHGVTEVLTVHDQIIVLEDDIVTSNNFLDFMWQALHFYKDQLATVSVSGFSSHKVKGHELADYYLSTRMSSWGWATWADRWRKIDWTTNAICLDDIDFHQRRKMCSLGSDFPNLLRLQLKNKIDSWAVRFLYFQWQNQLLSITPMVSKCQNIGFGDSATHTKEGNRFAISLDKSAKRNFTFLDELMIDDEILKSSLKVFSLRARLSSKLMAAAHRIRVKVSQSYAAVFRTDH